MKRNKGEGKVERGEDEIRKEWKYFSGVGGKEG